MRKRKAHALLERREKSIFGDPRPVCELIAGVKEKSEVIANSN